MDRLDEKILLELIKNARTPLTALSKKVQASREVVTYRIKKLQKEGIIRDFITNINVEALGFIGAAVFISIQSSREEEFRNFLNQCGFVSWVAEHSGIWNFGMSIYGKSNEEIDERFNKMYRSFKDIIISHRFTLHKKTVFFYEKYLGFNPNNPIKTKKSEVKIDSKDKQLLKELSKNARIESIELVNRVSLTAPAISQRIKKLEKAGIIEKYTVFLDISKLKMFHYSVFIRNKDASIRDKLLSYLYNHPQVTFVAEYIGNPFLEFGVIVKDPYLLRGITREIEEAFPANRMMEFSLIQNEFVSTGPPACVFE